jgi:hypothetical protein
MSSRLVPKYPLLHVRVSSHHQLPSKCGKSKKLLFYPFIFKEINCRFFFLSTASAPDGGEMGVYGTIAVVFCYVVVICTFPFSLIFCLKVSPEATCA